jgi:predicted acetyltransferase
MDTQDFVYGKIDTDNDVTAYGDVLADCFPMFFHGDVRKAWPWVENPDHFRLLRYEGRVAAGLVAVPVGQWFGGRSVSSWAIRLVGVGLEFRSLGAAPLLMQQMLREAQQQGAALSVLYPATQPLYRSVGYEQAGLNQLLALPVGAARLRDRTLALQRVDQKTAIAAMMPLYTARARRTSGNIDRSEWFWQRVLEPRMLPEVQVFLALGDAGPEGYMAYAMPASRAASAGYDLMLTDFVAGTAAATRRLMAHLGEHHSLGNVVRWRSTIEAPECLVLSQQRVRVEDSMTWMLRIVDVRKALTQRGYAPHLRGRLTLQVHDETLPDNAGTFSLEVAEGQAHVEPARQADLKLDVRGLAAVYSGHLTPDEVCVAGLGEGDEAARAMAAHLFAGPRCWMSDFF